MQCGHTHAFCAWSSCLSNGQTVMNPGSVGLLAYSDDSPVPHVMETQTAPCGLRDPRTRPRSFGWSVALRRIPYDFERRLALQAQEAGT